MLDELKYTIEKAIPGATAYILDPYRDGQHLQAVVVSESFDGQPLIKQHRAVMSALSEHLKEKVHAMGLKTFTPEKWNQEKHQYNLETE